MATDFPGAVTIYGTGLIGSSFALALRRCAPGVQIYGVDAPQILERARGLGIVEADDPQNSDLIILACPIGPILDLLDRLRPSSGIILDVGSTKVQICQKAARLGLPFVGGHPMAGSERSGPEAAVAELFDGTRFFLCPVATTPEGAIERIEHVVQAIGAIPHVIRPEDHDRLVAHLSHLPQILSTLLAEYTADSSELAGPGWKSVTRLAASSFHVWRDILSTSGFLPYELRSFIERLQSVLVALEGKDARDLSEIEAAFERANRSVSGGLHE